MMFIGITDSRGSVFYLETVETTETVFCSRMYDLKELFSPQKVQTSLIVRLIHNNLLVEGYFLLLPNMQDQTIVII